MGFVVFKTCLHTGSVRRAQCGRGNEHRSLVASSDSVALGQPLSVASGSCNSPFGSEGDILSLSCLGVGQVMFILVPDSQCLAPRMLLPDAG